MRPLSIFLLIVFSVSMIGYALIGWFDTFYRMGVFLVPVVVLIAALSGLFSHWIFHKSKHHSLDTFYVIGAVLFTGLITAHIIDNYKPTHTVLIPADYSGCILLFASYTPIGETKVDDLGIGYYPEDGQFNWKILQGDRNISEVLNESYGQQVSFPIQDSSSIAVLNVMCFGVSPDKEYPTHEEWWTYESCLDTLEFNELVNLGYLDQSKLRFKRFENHPN